MKAIKKIILLLLLVMPIVLFFGMFFKYTDDIPINDDYKAILEFMNRYLESGSRNERIKLFFIQHNEHRIVYDRVWTIICYKIYGKVDFNFLALVGNLALVGIFALLSKKMREINTNLLYLLPLSVLLFNIAFWENMTFAMATLSNTTVFLFTLASIYFVTKKEIKAKHLVLAIVFFILAVCTQGLGLFSVPLIAGILIYRKKYRFLGIYSAVALFVLALYFYGYEKPLYSPSIIDSVKYFKLRSVLFALAFMGNAFNYNLLFTNEISDSLVFSSILGTAFFLVYLYTIKTGYYKKNLFVFSTMTLIVLTACITGVTRCQLGLETAGAPRYRLSGVLFAIALFMWFIETRPVNLKRLHAGIVAGSLLYLFFISFSQYEFLSYRKRASLLGAIQYHSGDHTKLNGFEQDFYKETLVRSSQHGVYNLPSFESLKEYFPYSQKHDGMVGELNPEGLMYSVDQIAKLKDSYLIYGFAFLTESKAVKNQKIYLGLKSQNKETVYFSPKREPRFDINPYFKRSDLESTGFMGRVRFSDLEKGIYTVVIKVIDGNEARIVETDKTIDF